MNDELQTIINDPDKAGEQISLLLKGKVVANVNLCQGDAHHPPHLEVEFSDGLALMMEIAGHGDFVIGVAKKIDTLLTDHIATADLHQPSGALQ